MRAVATRERPDTPVARELIAELDALLEPLYPVKSQHGYTVDRLLREEVAFLVVYVDREPAGCGGVQLRDSGYGELKRMYVRPAFRGRGLGRLLVDELARHATNHGVLVLRLETGIHQAEAIGLYSSLGFERIPPFGEYLEDPLSLFMEKRLEP